MAIGPGVDEHDQWREQLVKSEARAQALADGATSASRGFSALAQQALPVLFYVAQLVPPPACLAQLDRRVRTRLAHCPFRAIPDELLFNPSLVGFRDSPPATMTAAAALMQTSVRHYQTWRRELDVLLRARELGGSLRALIRPMDHGADLGWRSRAFADHLAAAHRRLLALGCLDDAPDVLAPVPPSRSSIVAVLRGEGSEARFVAQLVSRFTWWKSKLPEHSDEFDQACATLPELIHRLRRVAPVYRFVLARTVCNAWVTSSRVRGDVAVCKFCRVAQDGVVHYMFCDTLW